MQNIKKITAHKNFQPEEETELRRFICLKSSAIHVQSDSTDTAAVTNNNFHTCQNNSLLSTYEYDARYFPSGEKVTALIIPL